MDTQEQLFFDPFAEAGEQVFDAAESFDVITERYLANEIEYDYSIDKFLEDTQALLLDAQFNNQFEQMIYIAERMHVLCQHDQQMQDAAEKSGLFDEAPYDHNEHDNHDHNSNSKDRKKKTKKIIKNGWLAFLWRSNNKGADK